MNRSVFGARLTYEPDFRPAKSENGKAYCKLSLALDHKPTEETTFLNCVCFGRSAEFFGKMLQKGQRYIFTTHMQVAHDKDGKYKGFEFILDDVEFLPRKKTNETADNTETA